jgi:hypothetical protein
MKVSICGYHLLMILSAVDFHFHHAEDLVIRDFLILHYPECDHLDEELAIISHLKPEEWEAHFEKVMNIFYKKASIEQQQKLVKFAINLVKADMRVTVDEHGYMQKFIRKYKLTQTLQQKKN